MTDLRTAAQQALEVLEQIAVLAEYGTTGPGKCHSRALNAQQATALRLSVSDLSRAQITALKAALAEPVQEPPEFPPHDDKVHAGAVYWYVGTDGKYYSSNEVKLFMETKNKSLHYEPPKWVLDNFDLIPLYTAPPQRKPLSEEDINRIDNSTHFHEASDWGLRFARAVERAHGIV